MNQIKLLTCLIVLSPTCCFAQSSQPNHPTTPETIIAMLPVAFFLFISIIIMIKLKKDKTKLSDLLSEKDTSSPPPAGGPANPPSASTSRFIAFITGLVALIIGVCLSAFFMYVYFSTPGTTVDLSKLANVIWGLGIGVLPYGFNKASTALK